LTKWSKKKREAYTLGSKAFSRRIGIESESEADSDFDSEWLNWG
jgi:hypothetical protein